MFWRFLDGGLQALPSRSVPLHPTRTWMDVLGKKSNARFKGVFHAISDLTQPMESPTIVWGFGLLGRRCGAKGQTVIDANREKLFRGNLKELGYGS